MDKLTCGAQVGCSMGTLSRIISALMLCTIGTVGRSLAGDTNFCAFLADDELVQEYKSPGQLLNATNYAKAAEAMTATSWGRPESSQFLLFQDLRRELIRRGTNVSSKLFEVLETEATRERIAPTSAFSGLGNYYAEDIVKLLVELRDPRAANALVRVLKGLDGKATPKARHHAHNGLERLTYISQFKQQPHGNNYADTVARTGASKVRDYSNPEYAEEAKFYVDWLKGEGSQPDRWLDLARKRAREAIEGDDLDAVYCAASFMEKSASPFDLKTRRDDKPWKTAARLAEILDQAERRGVEHEYKGIKSYAYYYKGQHLPVSSGNWKFLFAGLGRFARPHVQALIRLEKEADLDDWGGYRCLNDIGGKEVVGFFIEKLPDFDKELTKRGLDNHPARENKLGLETLPKDEKIKATLLADRICRSGIDRWTGHVFTNNAQRLEWWAANATKSEEFWLRSGVEPLAAAADAGNPEAQFVVSETLPDLPDSLLKFDWHPYIFFLRSSPEVTNSAVAVSRTYWLRENQRRLKFDADAVVLRLD